MSAQLGIAADSPQKLNLLIGQFENAHTYTTIAELVHHFQAGQLHITLSIQGNTLTMTHLWGQRKLLCPFSLREALTFVDEGRRRFHKTYFLGRTVFDPLTGALFYPQKLKLSEKETALLVCLLKAPRGGVSRLNLLKSVWGYDERLETRTLETHIYQLRQKIEHDPSAPSILVSTSSGYEITIERQGKVLYNQDKAFSG
jgi:DNA-binding winged helix-turn-helix (wHTH) protein